MKIQRKLAGFSACALVLSSLTVPVAHAASVDFKDIDSHWAKSSIERWAGYEIVNGFGNNQFKPEDTMTRAQMAQILSKTLGLTATATTNPFTDVSDSDWFKDAILKCNAAGIMNGTSATTANPNAEISRQDAVTMMGRALGIEADGTSTTFDDNGSIGNWAVGFVNAMAKRGIVNGRSEGMFAPTGQIKRGEIATILDRAITTYANTPNTEVTADSKGITLIAAPGVTVKGEALDVLIAPAATGTTKLDGVKVSGAVTMQAAGGTLVLGGTSTAAKVNIPTLATGAKITIEKDATVAAVNSAADNVAIDGAGKITNMTVANGKGVTVAGTVKVDKITNNSQDSMKHGDKVIAGAGGTNTTPVTPGGGGGGGGGRRPSYTDDDGDKDETKTVTAKNAEELIKFAKEATVDTKIIMKNDEDATARDMKIVDVINDKAIDLTIDLNDFTAKQLAVRAEKAENIKLEGDKDSNDGQIRKLILEAKNADVINDVTTGEVDIEAVGFESYHPTKPHNRINMKGVGHLDIPNTLTTAPAITVSTKTAAAGGQVLISGNVTSLEVNSPVQIVLNAIKQALKLTSKTPNARIQVQSAEGEGKNLTVVGSVDTLDVVEDTTVTVQKGDDGKDPVINTVTAGAGTTITSNKDVNVTVGKLEAKGDITVTDTTVAMIDAKAENSTIKVDGDAVVISITTSASIKLDGDGKVESVDATAANVTISKAEGATVDLEKVTAVGSVDPETVNADDFNKKAVGKQAAPTGIGYELSKTWKGETTITGVGTTMLYKTVDATEYKAVTTPFTVPYTGGAYLFVTAAADGKEQSAPTQVLVPAQVPVTSAEIFGSAVVDQVLKAVANSQDPDPADDVDMKYQWLLDGAEIVGQTGAELTVTKDMVGKQIKVEVSNYQHGKDCTAISPAVTAVENAGNVNKTPLKNAIDNARANLNGTEIATNAMTVEQGRKFVSQTIADAYKKAIEDAEKVLQSDDSLQSDLDRAQEDLRQATDKFNNAKQDGQKPQTIQYTVKFDSNGGSAVAEATVTEGQTVTKPQDPTQSNKVFDGWLLDGKPFDFNTALTAEFMNGRTEITLTAKWNDPQPEGTYRVNFDAANGTLTGDSYIDVNEGETVAKPADPTRTGFTFVQWLLDGEPFDFNTALTAEFMNGKTAITLTAEWRENTTSPVEVTFTLGEGVTVAGVTLTDGKVTVESGSDLTFTVTVPDGRESLVKVDGVKKDAETDGSYKITNITKAITVEITATGEDIPVVNVNAVFKITNATVTRKNAENQNETINNDATIEIPSDKPFTFHAKMAGLTTGNLLNVIAETADGTRLNLNPDGNNDADFTIPQEKLKEIAASESKTITITVERVAQLAATFTIPANVTVTVDSHPDTPSFTKEDSDAGNAAVEITREGALVFTAITSDTNKVVKIDTATVGGQDVKAKITRKGTQYTVPGELVTGAVAITVAEADPIKVWFRGPEVSGQVSRPLPSNVTARFAGDDVNVDKAHNLMPGEDFSFDVITNELAKGKDVIVDIKNTTTSASPADLTSEPRTENADKTGYTYTVTSANLSSVTEITVTIDTESTNAVQFVGEGGTADNPNLPQNVKIMVGEKEITDADSTTDAPPQQPLTVTAYWTANSTPREITLTAASADSPARAGSPAPTKKGNEWIIDASYFEVGKTVTITVATSANTLTLGEAPMSDHLTRVPQNATGTEGGKEAASDTLLSNKVTVKAVATTDADRAVSDAAEADYTISLSGTVPAHMNGAYTMGNWAGFALAHTGYTTANGTDYTGASSKVNIHRSSVSFKDAMENAPATSMTGDATSYTNPDGTAHVQKGFDHYVTLGQDNTLAGTYYLNAAANAQNKWYVVLEWTESDESKRIDKILVDTAGITAESSVTTSVLEKMNSNFADADKSDTEIKKVSYTVEGGKPVYTVELGRTTGVNQITSGIHTNFESMFNKTKIDDANKNLSTNNKVTKFAVAMLPKNLMNFSSLASGDKVIVKQDNAALRLFPSNHYITLYDAETGGKALNDPSVQQDLTDENKAAMATAVRGEKIAPRAKDGGGYAFLIMPGKDVTFTIYDCPTTGLEDDSTTADKLETATGAANAVKTAKVLATIVVKIDDSSDFAAYEALTPATPAE